MISVSLAGKRPGSLLAVGSAIAGIPTCPAVPNPLLSAGHPHLASLAQDSTNELAEADLGVSQTRADHPLQIWALRDVDQPLTNLRPEWVVQGITRTAT